VTTKLEKRVQIVLPVRVAIWTEEGRPTFQAACTYDVSVHGARLVGVKGVRGVGEILMVERGKNRALYRVVWMGKPGTPQQDQMGVQCVEQAKVIWDSDLIQMEEQYEPLLATLGDQLKIEETAVEVAPGRAQAQIFNEASGQVVATGELIRISHKACQVKTSDTTPTRSSVQILITAPTFDIRLRGYVQSSDIPGMLSLGLREIRRGDRRAFAVLMGA
jgi:hypothetical protein